MGNINVPIAVRTGESRILVFSSKLLGFYYCKTGNLTVCPDETRYKFIRGRAYDHRSCVGLQ